MMKKLRTIPIALIIVFWAYIHPAYGQDTVRNSDTSYGRGDLFAKFKEYDKRVAAEIKKRGAANVNLGELPKVPTETGYDPSSADRTMIQMPTRSKYDAGLMEGDDIQKHRDEMAQEDYQKMAVLVFIISCVGLVLWAMKKKPQATDSNYYAKKNSTTYKKTVLKTEIENSIIKHKTVFKNNIYDIINKPKTVFTNKIEDSIRRPSTENNNPYKASSIYQEVTQGREKADIHFTKYEELLEDYMRTYVLEYGNKKFQEVAKKLLTSNTVRRFLEIFDKRVIPPSYKDIVSTVMSIPYFGFGKKKTIEIGSMMLLQTWNEEINKRKGVVEDFELCLILELIKNKSMGLL
jgi:hypothetical protein